MKLKEDYGVVQSSSSFETSEATIEMTPEMFKLLSSGVYQYKIRAVIRELLCNCKDGIIMRDKLRKGEFHSGAQEEGESGYKELPDLAWLAGDDKFIDLHLPNALEPYIEFRDYGIGMCHEDIMGLYMTYGKSTKNMSNEFIGAMGIGCKSPYAYTDSFMVTSYFNGVARQYAVSMDGGKPKCMKISENPTEELNGLKIRIAVQRNDFNEFLEEASFVVQTFDRKPTITGATINDSLNVIATYGDVQLVKRSSAYHGSKFYVVMGEVRYSLDYSEICSGLKFIPMMYCDIFFTIPLGSAKIAPSRETLSLDKETKEFIINEIQKIDSNMLENIQNDVLKQKTFFDAIDFAKSAIGSDYAHFASKLFWIDKDKGTKRTLARWYEWSNRDFTTKRRQLNTGKVVHQVEVENLSITYRKYNGSASTKSITNFKDLRELLGKLVLIKVDTRGYKAIVKNMVRKTSCAVLIVNDKSDIYKYLAKCGLESKYNDITYYETSSEYCQDFKPVTVRKVASKIDVAYLRCSHCHELVSECTCEDAKESPNYYTNYKETNVSPDDLSEDAKYLEISRNQVLEYVNSKDDFKLSNFTVDDVLKIMHKAKIDCIYFVRKTNGRNFRESEHLTNYFEEFLKTCHSIYNVNPEDVISYCLDNCMAQSAREMPTNRESRVKLLSCVELDGKHGRMVKKYAEYLKNLNPLERDKVSELINANDKFRTPENAKMIDKIIKNIHVIGEECGEKVVAKYPLLYGQSFYNTYGDSVSHFEIYMKAVNNLDK